jgi:hypothetical protein
MADTPEFVTTSTSFSVYLIAAGLLRYLGASRPGREVEFSFADPLGHGPELERCWREGVVQMANPKTVLETRNRIIDEVKRLAREANV